MQSGGIPIAREPITFDRLISPVIEELTPLAKEMRIELAVDREGDRQC